MISRETKLQNSQKQVEGLTASYKRKLRECNRLAGQLAEALSYQNEQQLLYDLSIGKVQLVNDNGDKVAISFVE